MRNCKGREHGTIDGSLLCFMNITLLAWHPDGCPHRENRAGNSRKDAECEQRHLGALIIRHA